MKKDERIRGKNRVYAFGGNPSHKVQVVDMKSIREKRTKRGQHKEY